MQNSATLKHSVQEMSNLVLFLKKIFNIFVKKVLHFLIKSGIVLMSSGVKMHRNGLKWSESEV